MLKVWIELRYGSIPKGVLLAISENPRLLVLVKRDILKRIERRVEEVEGEDEILETIDRSELEKQRSVLDMLIPPETEELMLQTGSNGNG